MWVYYAHGRQLMEQRLTASGFPARNFSDLFPCWLGARELLLHGRDPYSPEITKEIQGGYYGRPIDSSRATDPIDEQRFVYPLFVVFLLAPTVTLPFTLVQSLFTALLFAATVCTVLLWIRVLGLKIGRGKLFAWIVLTLASIPFAEGIQLQQPGVLVAFFMAAAVYALAKEKFVVAGTLLAAAIMKPQLSAFLIGWVLLWTAVQWRTRKKVVIGFFSALAVLVVASEILLPRWPFEFVSNIAPYLRYTHATTGIHELLGSVGGTMVLLLLAGVIVFAVWRSKFEPIDSDGFRLTISLVLVFTCLVIPSLAPHNQVVLVPACLLLVKERKRIWANGRIARSLWLAGWLALAWPWVTGSILATTLVFGRAVDRLWTLPFATNPLIPITIFAALVLLVVRPSGVSRVPPLSSPLPPASST